MVKAHKNNNDVVMALGTLWSAFDSSDDIEGTMREYLDAFLSAGIDMSILPLASKMAVVKCESFPAAATLIGFVRDIELARRIGGEA